MTDALPRPRPRAPRPTDPPPPPRGSRGLTAALQASVNALDAPEGADTLAEVSPESMDELFDRINTHLAAGLPEAITDGELAAVVGKLRIERHRWQQEQEREKPARGARKAPTKSVAAATAAIIIDDL